MATLDLPLPTPGTPQIQIEGKNTVARLSGKRERADSLFAKTRESNDLFGSHVEMLGWLGGVGDRRRREPVSA